MAIRDMTAEDLIGSAETSLRLMRSADDVERLRGFAALQAIYGEMMDRHRARFNFLAATPLSGLAKTIADAMWDEAGNRMGGPRTAADAVIAAGWRQSEILTEPATTRIPPMWGLCLIDPSGKYGPHKTFYEYGETAPAAVASALARYDVAGTAVDPDRPPFLATAAQEIPRRSEEN